MAKERWKLNACMESFFESLKSEWVYGKRYASRGKARKDVFKYIIEQDDMQHLGM